MAAIDPTDLHSAGVGLTEGAIQWGRRPDQPQPIALTPRDIELFAWLEQHRFATTSLLALLFWGRNSSRMRTRLKLLHDAGYLDKCRPYVARGSAEWIYRLTAAGWQAVQDAGRSLTGRLPFGELTDLAYVAHDLQLDAMLLAAANAAYPGTGPLIQRLPFDWQGPDVGRVDPADEDAPARLAAAAMLPEGHVIRAGSSRRGVLEPDATLIGSHATTGEPVAVLIEYDRTLRPAKQIGRWRRYDHFLADGWRATRYATFHSEPIVVYVLPAAARLPTFLREADKHLTAWVGPRHGDPRDGEYPGREQIAFTSRDRLLAGDWTMLRVPSLPPEHRPAKRVQPRELTVPIMRLFAPRGAAAARAA